MAFHNSHEAERQLDAVMHRGQWAQALKLIDEWRAMEPWRTELLLRKAQVLRALQRYDQGLAAVREYRLHKPAAADMAFLEAEFLLELHLTAEARSLLDRLPPEIRLSARAEYYRGKVHLARKETTAGLQALWNAYRREPGFNRALVEWATVAQHHLGKWRVRRQLRELLADHPGNPMVAISVGLALKAVDERRGRSILRSAAEQYPEFTPAVSQRAESNLPAVTGSTGTTPEASDAYRIASEQILTGHFHEALDAYYRAVREDPACMPLLAPQVAEMLVDELVRPEEARLLLEEALNRTPTDYRLHVSYTKVFLQLEFAEEALSSANCALELAPETEKPTVLVLRALAYVLTDERSLAVADLSNAIARLPEVRGLIRAEPRLRPLARDQRFRALMADYAPPTTPRVWDKVWAWIVGL
ncbi:MAG: hypothetical protein ACYDBB_03010 [Armatimonadota bacterium]